jgi:hypothetical protein
MIAWTTAPTDGSCWRSRIEASVISPAPVQRIRACPGNLYGYLDSREGNVEHALVVRYVRLPRRDPLAVAVWRTAAAPLPGY